MKITIDLDTDSGPAGCQITVDGKKLARVTDLDLHLDMSSGELRLSRRTLGYGGRFTNTARLAFKSDGGPFKPY